MWKVHTIRLVGVLLLLGGMLAVTVPATPLTSVTVAQGKSDDKKDENASDKADKDKEKKDKKDKKDKAVTIDRSPYRVEVACDYDDAAGTSTCTFTGVVPDGGKKINHLDVPAATICADVLGGEFKPIEDDPHTGVTGYQTKGSTDTVTLVLEGEAVPEGTATYWLKAANAIMPASGPGLGCAQAATFVLETTPESAEPTAEPTATTAPTTGELVVLVYTCTNVPEDTTDFDWFRLCDSEGGVHQLSLAPVSEVAVEPVTMQTDESGDATFPDLEPGVYTLELTETTWCKAVSDNVDAQGNVIIDAGARTTVYTFVCEGKPAS